MEDGQVSGLLLLQVGFVPMVSTGRLQLLYLSGQISRLFSQLQPTLLLMELAIVLLSLRFSQ